MPVNLRYCSVGQNVLTASGSFTESSSKAATARGMISSESRLPLGGLEVGVGSARGIAGPGPRGFPLHSSFEHGKLREDFLPALAPVLACLFIAKPIAVCAEDLVGNPEPGLVACVCVIDGD